MSTKSPSPASPVLDGRDAYGIHRFIVVGLCTGATNAHRVALSDARRASGRRRRRHLHPGLAAVEIIRSELTAILARGVRMLFVYTGGWCNHVFADQFDEMFPGLPGRERVQVEFLRDADHTYVLPEHREALMRHLEQFARSFAG